MLQVNASRTSLLILLMTVSSAHAQSTDTADLVLADVMSTALELSPDVERGRLAVADSAGARRTAASPFDLRFQTSLNGGRENLPLYGQGALMASDTITTGALLEKSFRSGMVVSSSLSVGRLAHSAIRFRPGAPIPRSRWSCHSQVAVAEALRQATKRAAERLYDATRLEREHHFHESRPGRGRRLLAVRRIARTPTRPSGDGSACRATPGGDRGAHPRRRAPRLGSRPDGWQCRRGTGSSGRGGTAPAGSQARSGPHDGTRRRRYSSARFSGDSLPGAGRRATK